MVDFVTILMNDQSWNPQKLFNPRKQIPITPSFENDSIKLKGVKQAMFNVPKNQTDIDGYIDIS